MKIYSECDPEIIQDIKKVIGKKMEKSTLLEKYAGKHSMNFIQKYVETEIAISSSKLTELAYIIALIALVSSLTIPIMPTFFPDFIRNWGRTFYYIGVLATGGLTFYMIYTISKKDILKDIIIEIEYGKLMQNEEVKLTTQKTKALENDPILKIDKFDLNLSIPAHK